MFSAAMESMAQPNWIWAEDVHTGAHEFAEDVAVDPVSGNVVIVGVYNSSLFSFYGSSFSGSSKGGFVAKYDPNGNVLWAFKIGNNHNNICKGVAIDSTGNIYVTGTFELTTDFKGLSGTISNLTSSGGDDVFLAKYNSSGQLQWVRKGGGGSDETGFSVCLNSSSVFICGDYSNNAVFGSLNTVSNNPGKNIFIASYDFTGNVNWLADAGSSQPAYANDIVADNAGVYVGGEFKGTALSFFNSAGLAAGNVANVNSSKLEGYVAAFTTSGMVSWLGRVSSSDDDRVRSISMWGNLLYITGAYKQPVNFPGYAGNPVPDGGSNFDFYLAQIMRSTGITQWVKRESSSDEDEGLSLANDQAGNVYLGGFFHNTLGFSGGPTFNASGGEDEQIFIVSYTAAGSFRWVKQAGENGTDKPHGIALSPWNEIYVTGEYKEDAPFGSFMLTQNGGQNIFLAKIACPPILNNTISSSQTICSGTSPAAFSGSVPSGGTPPFSYSWEQSTDNINWVPAAGINNLQSYSSPALTDTTFFRRKVFSSSICYNTSTSNVITIYIDAPPTVSNAGPAQTVCINSASIVMNANTPSVGSGMWTFVSGSGSISSPSSPTTAVTGLSAGTNILKWTISNGVCPSSSSNVTIQVDQMPTISEAGSDQTICISSAATSFNANPASVGTGTWSLVSGTGNISSVSSESSSVSGLAAGTNIFMWSITNGVCPVSNDSVSVFVDELPSAALAGADQAVCVSSPFVAMNGNNPAVGNGLWSFASGSGTIVSPSSFSSNISGLAIGSNTLYWTITNGVCPSSMDSVSVFVDALPTVSNAGTDQTICVSSGGTTFNGNNPSVGNGVWALVSGTGSISNASLYNSTVNGLSVGNNVFEWTITNGVCASSADTILIIVDDLPTPSSAGNDQTICVSSGSVIMNANSPLIGSGLWSMISGSGSISFPASATTPVNGLATGTNIFKWTISNGTCAASSDSVSVFVDALPDAANAGADQTICISNPSTSLNANIITTGSGTWSLLSGAGLISSPFSSTANVNGLSAGLNSLSWTVTNGVCPSSIDTVNITVDLLPSVAIAGPDQTVCESQVTVILNGNIPAIGSGNWNLVSGAGSIVDPSVPGASYSSFSLGLNLIAWSISNGVCPANSDTMALHVDALPSVSVAGADQHVCELSPATTISANAPSVGTGLWSLVSGGGIISSPFSPVSLVTGIGYGSNTFAWTISNGVCPSSVSTTNVITDSLPDISVAGNDLRLCETSTAVNLAANIPATGTGSWSVSGTSVSISDLSDPFAAMNISSPGTSSVTWTISNGVCPSSASSFNVLIDEIPSQANAGGDHIVCISDMDVHLNANVPLSGSGIWTVVSGPAILNSAASPSSHISGFGAGENVFLWTISNGVCPSSSDDVIIRADQLSDTAFAGPDITTDLPYVELSANIPDPGTGTWSIVSGTGNFVYGTGPSTALSGLTVGTNILRWEIRNGVCPASTDELIITMNPFPIPNGFSPNGDGINDLYYIRALQYYEDVSFRVFNRWGSDVYKNNNYKNDWNGSNSDGQKLSDDTYYYVLEVMPGMEFSGFIIIKTK
jgi:gliding motility-associated-like protein